MSTNWPVAEVDPIARLRALAAGVSGAAVTERTLDADLATVWAVLSDFEQGFALVEPDMRRVRVTAREGDRVELAARSRWGFHARLRGTHRPGWLWLQSRFLLIGIAAAHNPGGGTRVAFTGGIRIPGRAALVPRLVRRAARGSLDRLERHLARRTDA